MKPPIRMRIDQWLYRETPVEWFAPTRTIYDPLDSQFRASVAFLRDFSLQLEPRYMMWTPSVNLDRSCTSVFLQKSQGSELLDRIKSLGLENETQYFVSDDYDVRGGTRSFRVNDNPGAVHFFTGVRTKKQPDSGEPFAANFYRHTSFGRMTFFHQYVEKEATKAIKHTRHINLAPYVRNGLPRQIEPADTKKTVTLEQLR
ncbi:MAG: hypothetical protein ACMXYF_04905 [Candidatus Woesearchaeota archaeon]